MRRASMTSGLRPLNRYPILAPSRPIAISPKVDLTITAVCAVAYVYIAYSLIEHALNQTLYYKASWEELYLTGKSTAIEGVAKKTSFVFPEAYKTNSVAVAKLESLSETSSEIKVLDLSGVKNLQAQTVIKLIKSMGNLEELNLSNTGLSNSEFTEIFNALESYGDLPDIKKISLSGLALNCEESVEFINLFKGLQDLDVSGSSLTTTLFVSLRLLNLQTLDVSSCSKLRAEEIADLTVIPGFLGSLKSLIAKSCSKLFKSSEFVSAIARGVACLRKIVLDKGTVEDPESRCNLAWLVSKREDITLWYPEESA